MATRVKGTNPHANDPHAEVQNNPQSVATAAPRASAPRVAAGRTGDRSRRVADRLGGTGLELIARRVLAKRGIDTSAPERLRSIDTLRSPGTGPFLRDVLEASVRIRRAGTRMISGRAVAETVIDGDDRERVFDTDEYPYSAIAALEITANDGSRWLGTGWFVGSHTVITAGHCVYIHDAESPGANGWVQSIRVIPGRNGTGSNSEPFGSVTATSFRSTSGWISGNPGTRAEFDYGAILLPQGSSPNGDEVGTFGIAVFSDEELTGFNLNLAGYPADKQDAERQTLWFDAKTATHLSAHQVFYDVDTFGGQSGAPVYIVEQDNRTAVAIHAYGTSDTEASNSGTRITDEVFQRIQSWKSMSGS